jgi:predicted PurR-regulated permease PerM
MDIEIEPPDDRARIGWWVFILILAAAAAFIVYSFVGMVVVGIFGYYATRPIYRQLNKRIDSDGIAAWVTLLFVLVPIVIVLFYAGFQIVQQAQQVLGDTTGLQFLGDYLEILSNEQRKALTTALQNPQQFVTNPRQTLRTVLQVSLTAISAIAGTLVLVSLGITLSYFFLKNDDAFADGFRQLVGGRDTTAYAYTVAVDRDLESVFFGNFLFVVVMAVIAAVAYWGTDVLAPHGIHLPMIFVLAFLTGVASLIPIVVGKVVYLPVVGYLGLQALLLPGNQLVFVGGALITYFLVLDILPQTFLQPYITGRQLEMILMMFAYLLGPILFGWYGFFLMPIVFILIFEAIRIVLPELVHGETLTPTVSMGGSIGTNLPSAHEESSTSDDSTDDGTTGDNPAAERD